MIPVSELPSKRAGISSKRVPPDSVFKTSNGPRQIAVDNAGGYDRDMVSRKVSKDASLKQFFFAPLPPLRDLITSDDMPGDLASRLRMFRGRWP